MPAEIENVNQGFVEQDTALESMRASDFDCYSAYGEVIDNSIQAFATDIRLKFEERTDRENTRRKKIGRVLFADNGEGMDQYLLHRCLKLGHSSRYNDRSGIGRFGVGMTLGAIHECQRVEVYSKIKGGKWYYTYIDLEEIRDGKLSFIPSPVQKDPKTDLVDYVEDSGTLVIWSKYDKQYESFENIIDESHFWIGRTFRKFIWGEAQGYNKVDIYINGSKVKAFDPLFVNKENTGFETETPAILLKPQSFPWTVPVEANSKNQSSQIEINVSLLPDDYRRESGKGGDQFSKDRFINRNEGISILRNDREVFYGHLPYANQLGGSEADRNVNRFIGCEIAFKAELDTEFEVKNIKRGAKPVRELKVEIIKRLAPTFRTQREKIRNRWNEKSRENEDDTSTNNSKVGISSTHSKTNEFLKKTKSTLLKNNKINDTEKDEVIGKKINPEASENEIDKVIKALKENGITIDEKEFIGDSFIDIEHGNQLKTLFYNTNSTFYKAYSDILDELKERDSELADKYKVLLDLIFVGYMLAESNIDPNEKMDGATFANELKQYWAINLSKILKKWNS
ncbi:ATP-binding protein [Salegentibacter mishustinae]|uniref:ATP-binding protein n=1 Tax=Salegentibacter mishustinae TaxID=270918 RepID=UPI002490329D|nr:ATP-binding protein [Salegentibacter mishustinae]